MASVFFFFFFLNPEDGDGAATGRGDESSVCGLNLDYLLLSRGGREREVWEEKWVMEEDGSKDGWARVVCGGSVIFFWGGCRVKAVFGPGSS